MVCNVRRSEIASCGGFGVAIKNILMSMPVMVRMRMMVVTMDHCHDQVTIVVMMVTTE